MKDHKTFAFIGKVDRITRMALVSGIIFVTSALLIGYQAYVSSRETLITNVYNSNLAMARSFRDYASSVKPLSNKSQTLGNLRSIWEKTDKQFEGGFLCVVDKEGTLTLHTAASDREGANVSNNSIKKIKPDDPTTLGELVHQKRDWVGPYVSSAGKQQVAAFSYIPQLQSVVSVHVPVEAIESNIRQTTLPWIIGLVLIGGVLLPLSMYLLHRAYQNSSSKLTKANSQLNAEIIERQRIGEKLNKLNEELETRVENRTKELKTAQTELLRNERMAALGQLTATVSHELRNPLGAMRPSLFVIKKKSDKNDERIQQAIERVDRGIDRCDHIIDELLDFTRIVELDRRTTRVDDWLESVIDEQDIPKDIRVVKDLSLQHVELAIDTDRLRRAIINVLDNACHAMLDDNQQTSARKGSCLYIKTASSEKRIEIIITDSGCGIAKNVLDQIFEPLYSTKGFGVGLGMTVVKQIMKQHGGGIEIATEKDKGTTMALWLPRNVADEEVAARCLR